MTIWVCVTIRGVTIWRLHSNLYKIRNFQSKKDKTDRIAASTTILARLREIRNEAIVLNQENVTVKSETDRFKRDYEIAQETIARMATQISSGHANDTDKTEEISKLNKLLLEAATEKDRLDAEVAYLKVWIRKFVIKINSNAGE